MLLDVYKKATFKDSNHELQVVIQISFPSFRGWKLVPRVFWGHKLKVHINFTLPYPKHALKDKSACLLLNLMFFFFFFSFRKPHHSTGKPLRYNSIFQNSLFLISNLTSQLPVFDLTYKRFIYFYMLICKTNKVLH